MTFLDTNGLVYALDASEPTKRARAVALLEDAAPDTVLSTEDQSEFYWTGTRKLTAAAAASSSPRTSPPARRSAL